MSEFQVRGADPRGLQTLVKKHAGTNPPVPPLPPNAEEAKLAGNVSLISYNRLYRLILYYTLGAFQEGGIQRGSGEVFYSHFNGGEPSTNLSVWFSLCRHLILTLLFQPTSAPLFANRSISHLKFTPPNTAAAVEDARQATVLDPKWGKGWVRLGDALLDHGAQMEEVKASYVKGLELIQEGGMRNGMNIAIL